MTMTDLFVFREGKFYLEEQKYRPPTEYRQDKRNICKSSINQTLKQRKLKRNNNTCKRTLNRE